MPQGAEQTVSYFIPLYDEWVESHISHTQGSTSHLPKSYISGAMDRVFVLASSFYTFYTKCNN